MILTNSSKSRCPSPSLSTLLTSIRVSSCVRQLPAALYHKTVAASLLTNRLVLPGYQWTFNQSPRCPEHSTAQLTTLPGQSCATQIMLSWPPDGNCVSLDGEILTDKAKYFFELGDKRCFESKIKQVKSLPTWVMRNTNSVVSIDPLPSLSRARNASLSKTSALFSEFAHMKSVIFLVILQFRN